MRVITADNDELKRLSRKLHDLVEESGFAYDTLVAVASAGIYIAENFPESKYFIAECHRAGSGTKKNIGKNILSHLPHWLSSALRMAESISGELRQRMDALAGRGIALREVMLDDALRDMLRSGKHRILIVDDASDSGRTLLSVKDTLLKLSPDSEVRTAVITQTRRNPVLTPDYCVYNNKTLIRFPWAPDY